MRPRHARRKRDEVLPRAVWLRRQRTPEKKYHYEVSYVIGTAMSSAKKDEYVWVKLLPQPIPVVRRIYRSTNTGLPGVRW